MPKNAEKNSPSSARNADSLSQFKPDRPAERRVLLSSDSVTGLVCCFASAFLVNESLARKFGGETVAGYKTSSRMTTVGVLSEGYQSVAGGFLDDVAKPVVVSKSAFYGYSFTPLQDCIRLKALDFKMLFRDIRHSWSKLPFFYEYFLLLPGRSQYWNSLSRDDVRSVQMISANFAIIMNFYLKISDGVPWQWGLVFKIDDNDCGICSNNLLLYQGSLFLDFFEGLISRVGGINACAHYPVREASVKAEDDQPNYLSPKFYRLTSLALFLLGSFLIGSGWWNAHYGDRAVWQGLTVTYIGMWVNVVAVAIFVFYT
jgi:hypothetical protein